MESCPFCAIVKNQLPAELVYEDEYALAFRDIRPQAPVHVLLVPKDHYTGLNDDVPAALLGKLLNLLLQFCTNTAESSQRSRHRTYVDA